MTHQRRPRPDTPPSERCSIAIAHTLFWASNTATRLAWTQAVSKALLGREGALLIPNRQDPPELELFDTAAPQNGPGPIHDLPSFNSWVTESLKQDFLWDMQLGTQGLLLRQDTALRSLQRQHPEIFDHLEWKDSTVSALWHLHQNDQAPTEWLAALAPLRHGLTPSSPCPTTIRIDGRPAAGALTDGELYGFLGLPLVAQDHWLKSIGWRTDNKPLPVWRRTSTELWVPAFQGVSELSPRHSSLLQEWQEATSRTWPPPQDPSQPPSPLPPYTWPFSWPAEVHLLSGGLSPRREYETWEEHLGWALDSLRPSAQDREVPTIPPKTALREIASAFSRQDADIQQQWTELPEWRRPLLPGLLRGDPVLTLQTREGGFILKEDMWDPPLRWAITR